MSACGAAGNLVASLLSSYLNTTMCTIAHALEKTKYPDADVHWCAGMHRQAGCVVTAGGWLPCMPMMPSGWPVICYHSAEWRSGYHVSCALLRAAGRSWTTSTTSAASSPQT